MSEEMKRLEDDLLVKFMLQECTAHEGAAVREWLALSPQNQLYYDQIVQIWEESKSLQTEDDIDTEAAWLRLKSKLTKPTPSFTIRRTLYYAAAAILLIGGLLMWYRLTHDIPVKVDSPEIVMQTEHIRSQQKVRIDTLNDHSVVTLNKNASLQYPKVFSNTERRVKLEGEAFFNITPDKQKPFYIDAANDVEIRVVGTSFNVKSFDAYTEVIVETGIVEVRKFNRVVLLHPREKARIDREDSTIVVEKSKDKLYKYFRSREFECDNTPLWKVVEVLNEAYGDSVVIGREDLKKLTLTTRFDNESLEDILDIISETFEITVEKKGGKYILK